MIELDSDRGKELGFTSDRFNHGSYLWDGDGRVMVSFIWSRQKGNFRELVEAVHNEGKAVAIPTPLSEMERIVKKNGYTRTEEDFKGGELPAEPHDRRPPE
jgi:5-formyltetrahydrofolate cyclo-ligase